MKKLALVLVVLGLTGCATQVEPWERERFTKTEMQLEPDPLDAAFKNHVYFSKEASSGGTSAAGGGCGCN
jgi:hypothetical protein